MPIRLVFALALSSLCAALSVQAGPTALSSDSASIQVTATVESTLGWTHLDTTQSSVSRDWAEGSWTLFHPAGGGLRIDFYLGASWVGSYDSSHDDWRTPLSAAVSSVDPHRLLASLPANGDTCVITLISVSN